MDDTVTWELSSMILSISYSNRSWQSGMLSFLLVLTKVMEDDLCHDGGGCSDDHTGASIISGETDIMFVFAADPRRSIFLVSLSSTVALRAWELATAISFLWKWCGPAWLPRLDGARWALNASFAQLNDCRRLYKQVVKPSECNVMVHLLLIVPIFVARRLVWASF